MRKTIPATIPATIPSSPAEAGRTAAAILDEAALEPVAGGDECLVCGQVFDPGRDPLLDLLNLPL